MASVASHLGKPLGFTCQTWLATDIADRHFGARYRTWFATTLNPPRNGSSSNPLVLFEELTRAVDVNDHYHARVEQLRQRLTLWVSSPGPIPPAIVPDLVREIKLAPVTAFRPALWKINLDQIDISRMIDFGQFPDEYLVAQLTQPEFEVISQ
jgi:hypothetical protein